MLAATADGPRLIDPEDLVIRRIPDVWLVEEDGAPRPSSQAFNNDGDGEPMSGYLDSALGKNRLARRDVLLDHPDFYAVALVVQVLLDEDQTVLRDPIVLRAIFVTPPMSQSSA